MHYPDCLTSQTQRDPLLLLSVESVSQISILRRSYARDNLMIPSLDPSCNCGISRLASIIIEEQLLFQHFENDECSSHHTQLVVPRSLRDQVLQDLHGGALSGHFREDKTLGRLRERFYWPGFHTDVTLWCQSCKDCARQKMATPKRRAHLKNVQVWSPMQVVAVDILGPLPKSSNGKLIHPCNW